MPASQANSITLRLKGNSLKILRPALHLIYATIALSSAALCAQDTPTTSPIDTPKEHVLIIMTDGLRWQEVFRGADPALLIKSNNNNHSVDVLAKLYLRPTPEESRAALMPFLWNHIVPNGEIYGNRDKGSEAYVTNGLNFSYPGYNETLTGHPDPRITSNDNIPNENLTVLEWLNREWQTTDPSSQNQTAAFGAWPIIGAIVNQQRAGFTVNVGYDSLTSTPTTPQLDLLNHIKAETPRIFDEEPFDTLTFHSAFEYLKTEKPRLLFLSLGETDEWGHAGNYGFYLEAAHRVDQYLQTLWDFVQSDPDYRDHTTLIFLTDHGRGHAPVEWRSHGEKIPDSKYIFIAAMGAGVPARGELDKSTPPVTQSQIAATIAQLFGKDWNKQTPEAGKPLEDIK
jgi:hypothetical protein